MLWIFLMMAMQTLPTSEEVVFDFSKPEEEFLKKWFSINDVVMGGLSESKLKLSPEGNLVFYGVVRPDNFGGFASVRTDLEKTFKGFKGIKLKVLTDGNIYQVRLKTDRNFDGINYTAKFTCPPGKWQEIAIPLSEFTPVFRGRSVANYPALKSEDIQQFGFLISDKQFGEFELKVEWVKFY